MSIVFRTKSTDCPVPEAVSPDVTRLWLLRLLVPLELHRKLVRDDGVQSDALADMLGIALDDSAWKAGDRARIVAHLRSEHARAELRARRSLPSDSPGGNLDRLSAVVGLSPLEQRVLEFVVVLSSDPLLDRVTNELGMLSSRKVVAALSVLLDAKESLLWQALGSAGVLCQSGLLQSERSGSCQMQDKFRLLSDRFAECMQSPVSDPMELLTDVIGRTPAPELGLHDYEHLRDTLDVLLPYLDDSLQRHRKGVNVLVYGPPGTGKTQLARVLAAHLKCGLYDVTAEDEDGDPVQGFRRLCAYRVAQSLLCNSRSMMVFDEMEDVCGEYGGNRNDARGSKAWFNRMLEDNQVPTLWMTNDISSLDAAFIRRFDMVFELAAPPRSHRLRIVRQLAVDWLDDAHAQRLADAPGLAPAVMARAARITRVVGMCTSLAAPSRVLCHLIDNTLKAQGHARLRGLSVQPIAYDPEAVGTDVDLQALADGLARSAQARICLYGPPGTGKTAYARWLAERLDRPLQVERASDILSKWVGETEHNLARCFRQAEDDGAMLLIDEVDSLLQDRSQLGHAWQAVMVNEMLTQMEEFAGVFVATTNRMDNLDPAALRRFDLKARFGFLTPQQARALFARYCREMQLEAPPDALERVGTLHQLTPGDFASVARQARFRPFAGSAEFIGALHAECALKEGSHRAIGFVI